MRFNELSRQRKFLFRYRIKIISTAVFIIMVIIGSVVTYSISSSFFVTPIETVVGKSNEQLRLHYNKMAEEYSLLDSVLRNLKERDAIVYKQLFGINISEIQEYNDIVEGRENRREELTKLSFAELATTLLKECDNLNTETKEVGKKLKRSVDIISKNTSTFRGIPSIQPINNSDLSRSITPTGMRINPFVKSFAMHKGIDYSIPEETRVYATADGSVQTVLSSGTQGGTITLSHNNNYTTTYGNLSKTIVSQGNRVKRGDIIGYSGNTGTSFLPHLHYEVKYGKRNLDPFDFFFGELSLYQIEKIKTESAQNIQSFD